MEEDEAFRMVQMENEAFREKDSKTAKAYQVNMQ